MNQQQNKFNIGNLEFTLDRKPPTQKMFNNWKGEYLSLPETNNYKVWLTGGFIEDWETNDIDIILTGKPNYKEIKNLLYQARIIGVKYGLVVDISHWNTEPMYIYENFPVIWGVGNVDNIDDTFEVIKINIDYKFYVNDKLIKEIKHYKQIDEGLYEYNFTYPTKKQLTRDYKSKPILLIRGNWS